jgi:heavy metal sensor kinase
MKRRKSERASGSFLSSVRVRLTFWYLAVMAFIMILFGGSLYYTTYLNSSATTQQETQLYQNAQQFGSGYRQAILSGQSPASQRETLSSDEFVLLLSTDGTVLDKRGTLPSSVIQQLQSKAQSGQALFDLTMPQSRTNSWHNNSWHSWWGGNDYRVLITPVMDKDTRVAILVIGLQKEFRTPLLAIWLFHGILGLLAAAIGGFWLAGKSLRPVKMITRMANEINASDLRRRLNLRRRDEFGELAATFDQMLGRLDAAFKRQTRFTADASHELRTPLTIINLEVNRALTQLSAPEEYRQVLELIQSENERMTAVVNSLLLLARADTGQIALHLEEVDLSDVALDCVERLLPLARQSCITLLTGDLPEMPVMGDQQYLSRMVMNLVENAIKYTRGTGKSVCVEVAEKHGQWGLIRVQDDGPGIAEEHLPYLFDRFYRVDKARSHNKQEELQAASSEEEPGGTGLGLAIVQWIVQAHSGEVLVESKMGAGSTFEVRLPLIKQHARACI